MKENIPVIEMADSKEHSLQFELQTMEYIDEHRHNRIDHPHKHDYFVIIWMKSGEGKHMVDFQEFVVEQQSIFFLTPGQVHQLQTATHPDGYVLSFHNDFFCTTESQRELLLQTGLFYNCSQFKPYPVLPEQAAMLEKLLGLMQAELNKVDYMHYESLRGLLQLFLIQCSRFWGHSEEASSISSRPAWLTRRFLNLLETNYRKHTKVNDYAAMLVVTPNHLNETIKKTTGFPASDHIKKRVILEAKRMAVLENSSAKEIAHSLGFDDEAHFSKYFKNNTGLTFSKYRISYYLGGRT
ncbi:AraC family transcriptional regulator [Flavihumibacter sp. UBA7668]|uniref:AraC family transcriptional regulator n=1 Tax=Flavihumibacter sp. UBA7668 TaxID=1946542 RepID=UPI0025BAD455|nr:helix-turn-helix transcriptional regulator [Flavihumibacter sp. UBA7668]